MEIDPRLSMTPPSTPSNTWGISYGGGVNSTALIIECCKRGFTPDWITFSDTGCEKPETYKTLEKIKAWLRYYYPEWPEIITLRWIRVKGENKGTFVPLDQDCLSKGHLPAKAYGYSKCTQYYKIAPCDKWRKAHGYEGGCHAIGYDTSESRRLLKVCNQSVDLEKSLPWFPLYAWGISRAGCEKICKEAGIEVRKSSCYFCPAQTTADWEWLKEHHPDLWDRSVKMYQQAISNGRGGFQKAAIYRMLTEDGASSPSDVSSLCTGGHCGL